MEVATPRPGRLRRRRASFAPLSRRARLLVVATLLAGLAPAVGCRDADVAAPAKVLRVATSGDYAPFSFPAAAAASPTPGVDGFDVEVAKQFARERGYRVEFVRFRWPDLSSELVAGRFDVAMSGVTMRPERSIAGRFSVPVAATHAVALTWEGSGAGSLEELDLPTRRIAVNAGGHLEKVARQVFQRAAVVAIADNNAVRMALLDRSFDAVVTDNYEETVWTASARGVVRIGPLSDDRKAYLLPAGGAQLAAELDRWLLAREQDGTLAKLRERFFARANVAGAAPSQPFPPTADPVAALSSAIVERLALMPMVYEAKKRSGKPIEDKDQEAAVLDAAVRAVLLETEAASLSGSRSGDAARADAPDTAAVRSLFEVLIAMGKDAQQSLSEAEARTRAGVVLYRPTASPAETSAGGSSGNAAPAAVPPVEPAPAAPSVVAPPAAAVPAADTIASPRSPRVYDLAGEIRPAIGRITTKIACILVAMKEPIPQAEARRRLGDELASHDVKSERLDAMAAAVARISSR